MGRNRRVSVFVTPMILTKYATNSDDNLEPDGTLSTPVGNTGVLPLLYPALPLGMDGGFPQHGTRYVGLQHADTHVHHDRRTLRFTHTDDGVQKTPTAAVGVLYSMEPRRSGGNGTFHGTLHDADVQRTIPLLPRSGTVSTTVVRHGQLSVHHNQPADVRNTKAGGTHSRRKPYALLRQHTTAQTRDCRRRHPLHPSRRELHPYTLYGEREPQELCTTELHALRRGGTTAARDSALSTVVFR